MPVSPKYPMLIPDRDGAYPSYFIYGPMVFSAPSGGGFSSFAGFG